MQAGHTASSVGRGGAQYRVLLFGIHTKIQYLKKLVTLKTTFDFFLLYLKKSFSRASSTNVSVHFIHKSGKTIPLKVLDKLNVYFCQFFFIRFIVSFVIVRLLSWIMCILYDLSTHTNNT